MYNFTTETSGTNTYLVYKLEGDKEIDTLSLGMVVNNQISHVLPIIFTQIDSDKFLKYNVSSKISLKQFFSGVVNKKRLLTVFSGILKAIINSTEYMIEPSSFILDPEYIYVDVSRNRAYLLCMPLMDMAQNSVDTCAFFKNLMFSTQFDQSENTDYVVKLISYLNSNSFVAPEEFLVLIEQMLYGIKPKSSEQDSAPLTRQPIASQNETKKAPEQAPINKSIEKPAEKPDLNKAEQPEVKKEEKQQVEPKLVRGFAIPGGGVKEAPVKAAKKEKEHKGFSFFGKKKDKAEQESPKKGKDKKKESDKNEAVSKINTAQSASSSGNVQSVNVNIPEKPKANFGETTVLGGGSFGETTVLGVDPQAYQAALQAYLVRKKNNENILVAKDSFKIGKEKSFVDYFIGDNTAISRSHASITKKNDEYYLIDMNSTNHTYLNGQILSGSTEYKLSSGDVIKLANEEFEFIIK